MAQPSSIDRLPEEVRQEIHRLCAEPGVTLDEIVAVAESMGVEVSRSAVHRKRATYRELSRKIRETEAVARAMASELGPDLARDDTGRHLVSIIQTLLFKFTAAQAEGDEVTLESKDFKFITEALRNLQQSMSLSVRRESEIRKQVAAEVAAKAASEAEAAGQEAGLSADTVDAIKRRILGVRETANDRPGAA